MNFETITSTPRVVTIEGIDYQASPLNVSELSDISNRFFKQDGTAPSLYDTAVRLVFNAPHVALYYAIYKNDNTIKYDVIEKLNFVANEESTELVAYLVGVELQKKTT